MTPPRSPWPFRVLYALAVWSAIMTSVVDVVAHAWLVVALPLTLITLSGAWLALLSERRELPPWLEGWELRWPIYRPDPLRGITPMGAGQFAVFQEVVADLAPGEGGEADERARFP